MYAIFDQYGNTQSASFHTLEEAQKEWGKMEDFYTANSLYCEGTSHFEKEEIPMYNMAEWDIQKLELF